MGREERSVFELTAPPDDARNRLMAISLLLVAGDERTAVFNRLLRPVRERARRAVIAEPPGGPASWEAREALAACWRDIVEELSPTASRFLLVPGDDLVKWARRRVDASLRARERYDRGRPPGRDPFLFSASSGTLWRGWPGVTSSQG